MRFNQRNLQKFAVAGLILVVLSWSLGLSTHAIWSGYRHETALNQCHDECFPHDTLRVTDRGNVAKTISESHHWAAVPPCPLCLFSQLLSTVLLAMVIVVLGPDVRSGFSGGIFSPRHVRALLFSLARGPPIVN